MSLYFFETIFTKYVWLNLLFLVKCWLLWPHRLTARTADSHSVNRGSIPRGVTNESMCQSVGLAHAFVYDLAWGRTSFSVGDNCVTKWSNCFAKRNNCVTKWSNCFAKRNNCVTKRSNCFAKRNNCVTKRSNCFA